MTIILFCVIFMFVYMFWCDVKIMEDQDKCIQQLNTQNTELIAENKKILSQKKSSEVRLGQITEHLTPFLQDFPYDPKQVRFLGSPIDYVVFDFENNRLVILECKTGKSSQTEKQKAVKKMVEEGRVYYEILRINKDIKLS